MVAEKQTNTTDNTKFYGYFKPEFCYCRPGKYFIRSYQEAAEYILLYAIEVIIFCRITHDRGSRRLVCGG
jgi:hypothetical protein